MVMKLLLMRHAGALSKADARAKFDADRPLSQPGAAQAKRVGRLLTHLGCLPQPIVCSPFVRTQETAAAINDELPQHVPLLPLTILAPGSGSDELLRAAVNHGDPTHEWLLAVMHEPDISLILGTWLYGGEAYPFEVQPADIFGLRVGIAHGKSSAKLLFSYSPVALSEL